MVDEQLTHPDTAEPAAVTQPKSLPDVPGQIVRTPGQRRGAKALQRNADGLTPRQKQAVQALLQETSISRAAVFAGLNERTLRRWLEEVPFQRAYHAARRSAFGQSIGLMQRYSPMAVTTLVQVMTDTSVHPAARVAAAATLLKFGREGIELDDLALRIESLEKAAEEPQAKPVESRPWEGK